MDFFDFHPDQLSAALRAAASGATTAELIGLFIAAASFGALHTLLPGHGKTMLAVRQIDGARSLMAVRDAMTIGFMRVTSAAVLVLAGSGLTAHLSGSNRVGLAGLLAGITFTALGVYLVWTARHDHRSPDPINRLPVYVIGMIPDPVAASIMVGAMALSAPVAGTVAALGIACGMSVTLSAFGFLGDRIGHGVNPKAVIAGRRIGQVLRIAGGFLVFLVGLWLLTGGHGH